MNEVRITLIGKVLPWWDGRMFFGEIRALGGRSAWENACRSYRYGRFINELRHATMLEF